MADCSDCDRMAIPHPWRPMRPQIHSHINQQRCRRSYSDIAKAIRPVVLRLIDKAGNLVGIWCMTER